MKRALLILAAAAIAVWTGDLLSVRYGFPGHRSTYGSVTVRRTYAVPEKNMKKEDYFFLDPEAQTCVNSLFPHFGYPPCWYLERHRDQQVQM